jgi:hypothetical protein
VSVSIEFVGGPKDGDVLMLHEAIPQLELPMSPRLPWTRAGVVAANAPIEPIELQRVIYRRREGPPRLDGVLFYDYAGVR